MHGSPLNPPSSDDSVGKSGVVPPQPGEIFEHAYPFVHSTYTEMDEDGCAEVPCWKPGVRFENTYHGDTDSIADGTGKQIITVVDSFKPGRFPTRVFYTRRWVNPDGKEFGKGLLRIAAIQSFRTLVRGYRHEVTLRESPLPICGTKPKGKSGNGLPGKGEF